MVHKVREARPLNVDFLSEPGGYIQWSEVDLTTMNFIAATPKNSTDAIESAFNFVSGAGKSLEGPVSDRYVIRSRKIAEMIYYAK